MKNKTIKETIAGLEMRKRELELRAEALNEEMHEKEYKARVIQEKIEEVSETISFYKGQ